MNILRVTPDSIYLNVFPRKATPYYFIPSSDIPHYWDRPMSRSYYTKQLRGTSICINTTASTWDEARQLHPELFI